MRWFMFPLGIALVAAGFTSLLQTLVVPRGLISRPTAAAEHAVRSFFLFVANRFESYEAKDRVLVLQGPVTLLALLVMWLVILLSGYTLMLWPFIEGGLQEALREAGASMTTVGFAGTETLGATIIDFTAAFSGLIVIALQIAYLPTLYAAFNRREKLVTLLQSRAGAPAWGPELLVRHQLVGLNDNLPQLYSDWEGWASDVAESHTNYPILIYLRSPHALRSWIVALIAVLDAAALQHSLNPSSAPSEARLCLRMGFSALRAIAAATRIPFEPDPFPDDPVELAYPDFRGAIGLLEEAGFPMERSAEEAWPHFKGWRVNYESVAYAIADRVVAPPGPWSGPRRHLPGFEIVPQRPADRKPGQMKDTERPRGSGQGS